MSSPLGALPPAGPGAPRVARQPYHHGALREAMIAAGVQLAREGGPDAIVLREVARRTGVSPNAAYRHFEDLSELTGAVSDAALGMLARFIEEELQKARDAGNGEVAPLAELMACGKGYVHFALAEPGLFAVAFIRPKASIQPDEPLAAQAVGETAISAADFLLRALDRLVEEGLMAPEDQAAAVTAAWASVHGLSTLLLGPLGALAPEEREPMIEASLRLVCRGITGRRV